MLNLKKMFGLVGAKQVSTLPPLVLSESLCNSLVILSTIFGQAWHLFVVGELQRTLAGPVPPSGQTLAMILSKLLEEASVTRPGLSQRFVITRNQIVFRSADRRYVVLIVQGEGDRVRVVWQVSVRNAGTSYISYEVSGKSWRVVEWKVAEQSEENLELLAKAGGEVLGFLEECKLLPPGSPFQRALDAQVAHSSGMKDTVAKSPEKQERLSS
jgi:hypothetical protein